MMEHLAVEIPLSLLAFCERCRLILNLPEFTYASENETEWGVAQMHDSEFNISRPYQLGTLQEWDNTVPDGCNFGISLILYDTHPHAHDHDWALANLVAPAAQGIANELNVAVHYHRTWLGPGQNVSRRNTFHPIKA